MNGVRGEGRMGNGWVELGNNGGGGKCESDPGRGGIGRANTGQILSLFLVLTHFHGASRTDWSRLAPGIKLVQSQVVR